MNNISKALDEVMVNITVKSMLNPDNPDFYIGALTLDKVKSLFAEMNDPKTDVISVFWKAFHIARAKYEQSLIKLLNKQPGCPECGCSKTLGYVTGLRCPNCDYIEE